jgi:hypothetical protein
VLSFTEIKIASRLQWFFLGKQTNWMATEGRLAGNIRTLGQFVGAAPTMSEPLTPQGVRAIRAAVSAVRKAGDGTVGAFFVEAKREEALSKSTPPDRRRNILEFLDGLGAARIKAIGADRKRALVSSAENVLRSPADVFALRHL